MKLVEFRGESALEALRPCWNDLLQRSSASTIFLTWEWLSAWWNAYGAGHEMCIVAAYDDDNVLKGLAPLFRATVQRFGRPYKTLHFIGDGSNDSEYLDFIVDLDSTIEVRPLFDRYLADCMAEDTVVLLNEIPSTSPTVSNLRSKYQLQSHIWKEADAPCATVSLPCEWEAYLGGLKPRFRTKIRSALRQFEDRKEVQFGYCATQEQLDSLLPVLFALHTRRWAADSKPGVFGWKEKREFYQNMSSLLLERGWLRFSWLKWNDTVIACQYGFAYDNKYFHLQEGYEPASEHWSAGIALRAWSIRECIREGINEYDFLGGIGRHKRDWGAKEKQSARITTAVRHFRNRLYCDGPDWTAQLREATGRLTPRFLLEARRAWILRRQAIPVPSKEREQLSSVKRTFAAGCYYHLGASALLKPLRERFQLSSPSATKRPSLGRRTRPCARILCYHRVNDTNTPFFPAINSSLFDAQMRFLAKHHKVVSLADLVEHLNGDSTEPVLSITFDDGYRDNFTTAFPILQRYSLPATVFLTTGCIDAQAPLWFESLAQAITLTTQEFLDLEIDIPRRFWLRSEHERLEANSQLFALLRLLPDSLRQDWLATIVRSLNVAPELHSDRMLTWDHIRTMRQAGIEFGGHTVTHPFVSKLAPERMTWEVTECKRRIQAEIQAPVRFFAYPNGKEEDFASWNKDLIRTAGYTAAVTTIWGLNYQNTDRMALRRSGPWENNAAVFAYKLDWYQFVNG